LAAGAVKAVQNVSLPPEGEYLIKLGKRRHMLDLYEDGRLKISPASAYADPSLNPAIQDDELAVSSFGQQSEVLIEAFDRNTGQRKAATRPIGNLKYTSRSKTDFYVYCMASNLDFRLFTTPAWSSTTTRSSSAA
jgi:hypothetical protein